MKYIVTPLDENDAYTTWEAFCTECEDDAIKESVDKAKEWCERHHNAEHRVW